MPINFFYHNFENRKESYILYLMYTERNFEKLYKSYYSQLFQFAFTVLHDEDLSHDVVDEVFAELWEKKPAIHKDKIKSYLFCSIRNRSLNLMKAQQRQQLLQKHYLQELAQNQHPQEFPDKWKSIKAFIETHLSPKEKEVLDMCFDQEMSYKQAASQLNTSVSSINKHIVNALKKLRNHFNPAKNI